MVAAVSWATVMVSEVSGSGGVVDDEGGGDSGLGGQMLLQQQ